MPCAIVLRPDDEWLAASSVSIFFFFMMFALTYILARVIHRVHKESRKRLDIALSQSCAFSGRFQIVQKSTRSKLWKCRVKEVDEIVEYRKLHSRAPGWVRHLHYCYHTWSLLIFLGRLVDAATKKNKSWRGCGPSRCSWQLWLVAKVEMAVIVAKWEVLQRLSELLKAPQDQ